MIGRRFHRLLVIADAGMVAQYDHRRQAWHVRCDCGTTKVLLDVVLKGGIKSCGCLRTELCLKMQRKAAKLNRTHGEASHRTPEYTVWASMIDRCTREKNKSFADYGGRGIHVCKRWRASYEAFLEDMGRRPTQKHSLDRIDNDGPYSPSNCRWATRTDQNRNRRDNRPLTVNGKTKCIQEWADESGLSYLVIFKRLRRGWSPEMAISTPAREQKLFTYRGKTQNLRQWSIEYDIVWSTLNARLKRGIPFAQAIKK